MIAFVGLHPFITVLVILAIYELLDKLITGFFRS